VQGKGGKHGDGKKHKKDIELGGITGDDLKIPGQTNAQAASAFMTKILLVFGLGRGNWNVGNNSQLASARKRLTPSYATTVGGAACFPVVTL
jgi:hypothetical protein